MRVFVCVTVCVCASIYGSKSNKSFVNWLSCILLSSLFFKFCGFAPKAKENTHTPCCQMVGNGIAFDYPYAFDIQFIIISIVEIIEEYFRLSNLDRTISVLPLDKFD